MEGAWAAIIIVYLIVITPMVLFGGGGLTIAYRLSKGAAMAAVVGTLTALLAFGPPIAMIYYAK